ncbi:unnamed protein product [Oikopleura dioica]|uniref:V-type proton ATPase subunit S1/VOA1 transmembrane domain-containing protein n=1 Tax=Oikopleura dioica TaxID=34765 RepID=E4XGP2_OIKDI|nr:unnamed protein product [Oikopleura dioica]
MKLLHGLLSLISASQMMLVWNCPNSDGPSGAFLESIPDCPGALQLNVPISMGDLEKLSTVQKSGKTPSLFFLKSSHEEIAQVAIEEADSLIAERIKNGQAVILLGTSFQTNNKIEVPSTDEFSASVDRKVLQAGGASDPGWINYPERAFEEDCGAIKIGPTVQVYEGQEYNNKDIKTYTIDSDTTKWSCDKASMSISVPTSEGKTLKFKFEEVTNLESNYQSKTWFLEFDGLTYGDKNQTLPIELPWDKVSNFTFSYTCNKSKLKNVEGETIHMLLFGPYQIQYGAAMESKAQPYFSRAIDCTPVFGEMVWITVIAMVVFTTILAFGLYFVVSIEVPSRFETPRSRQLIIPDN